MRPAPPPAVGTSLQLGGFNEKLRARVKGNDIDYSAWRGGAWRCATARCRNSAAGSGSGLHFGVPPGRRCAARFTARQAEDRGARRGVLFACVVRGAVSSRGNTHTSTLAPSRTHASGGEGPIGPSRSVVEASRTPTRQKRFLGTSRPTLEKGVFFQGAARESQEPLLPRTGLDNKQTAARVRRISPAERRGGNDYLVVGGQKGASLDGSHDRWEGAKTVASLTGKGG